ncbi:MAG TPA: O-antigen ligase family protein [Gammaproteobacteria bacterium]|nr:O-antigen ligase family protein [Gammaproteobacteria bacterium]
MNQTKHADEGLFYGFLALLYWLPLPLGSNRGFAIMIFVLAVCLLTLLWLILFWKNRVHIPSAFRHSWPLQILLFLFLGYIFTQLLPLPPSWVAVLSPKSIAHWNSIHIFQQARFQQARTSAYLSLSPDDTLWFLLKSVSYVLFFNLTLLLVRSHSRIRLLLLTLVISGTLQAIYGSLMVLSGMEFGFFVKKVAYLGSATGTFVNRNHLAGYLEMCLAAGIGLLIMSLDQHNSTNWRQRFANLVRLLLSPKIKIRVALAFMVIGLVITHSRMGNSAFFISLIVTGILWMLLSGQRPGKPVLLLLASLFVVDLFIVGSWFGVDKVVQRIENTRASDETRDEVVRDSMVYTQNFRLTGSGGGTFASVYPIFRQADVKGFYDHAHNDYLEFLLETGIIGVALLGIFTASSVLAALLAIRKRHSTVMRGTGFAATMGLIAILIHSLVDFNLQIPANAALFMVFLALSWIALFLGHHQRLQKSSTS